MIIKNNNTNTTDYTEKMQRCLEYIEALEAERRKIQVFERELPLCLELVTQAIEGCRQQMSGTTTDYFNGQSECSEQTSPEGQVLEEFIPMKRTCSNDEDLDLEQESRKAAKLSSNNNQSKDCKSCDNSSKKSDWLRSVQLCIQTPDSPVKEDSPRKVAVVEVKKNPCGAFHPFKKGKGCGAAPVSVSPTAAASSTAETGGGSDDGGGGGGGSKSTEDKGQSNRKARRCWSPELHRRFLQALQQLGGSHVATPKQIRELMKVDGLSNDEVKSHLQKYRLHTRRPSPPIHNSNNSQTPQFVVVGGIWMPPPEYATAMGSTPTSGGDANNPTSGGGAIYAPRASLPPPSMAKLALASLNKRQQSSKRCHSEENSPSTSSSMHTTTASPAF